MKRPNDERPENLINNFSRVSGDGLFSRPVRFLVLRNGDMIAMMEEHGRGSWQIFTTQHATGRITKSPVYKMRSVANVMFQEAADDFAEADKEFIAARALAVPYEQATPQQKLQIAGDALEYMRLRRADEDSFEGTLALAERLSPEEVTSYIQESIDARTRQEAAEAE